MCHTFVTHTTLTYAADMLLACPAADCEPGKLKACLEADMSNIDDLMLL